MNTDNSKESYLTTSEVAKRLKVATVTVRKWAQKGMLRAVVTPGGHRRYTHDEVMRFAKSYNLPLDNLQNTKLRILIVDDDEQLIDYFYELLTIYEDIVEVDKACNGFDAGNKVHTFRPDVVLLDLMMPGMDGNGVCQLIKSQESTENIRVVAMTGYPTEENKTKLLEAGAEIVLSKPVDQQLLLNVIGITQDQRKTSSKTVTRINSTGTAFHPKHR